MSANHALVLSEEVEEGTQPTLAICDDDQMALWPIGVQGKAVTERLFLLMNARFCFERAFICFVVFPNARFICFLNACFFIERAFILFV